MNKNYRFNGYCNIVQGVPGAANKADEILDDLIDEVDTLSRKGLLPEGDIERLEKAASKAEAFLRPQSEEPAPWIGELADAHFNQLTPAQAERLAILMEECGEVVQIIGKILRHGYDSCSPFGASQETNRQALVRELFDIKAAAMLIDIDLPEMAQGLEVEAEVSQAADAAIHKAFVKKLSYSHHQAQDYGDFMAVVETL